MNWLVIICIAAPVVIAAFAPVGIALGELALPDLRDEERWR
jgi:hypothetical protein